MAGESQGAQGAPLADEDAEYQRALSALSSLISGHRRMDSGKWQHAFDMMQCYLEVGSAPGPPGRACRACTVCAHPMWLPGIGGSPAGAPCQPYHHRRRRLCRRLPPVAACSAWAWTRSCPS